MAQINAGLAEVARYRLKEQGGDPANPAAGYTYIYFKGDGFYYKDDAGNVVGPIGADIGARVTNSGNQDIVTGTDTDLLFDTETYDTDNIHSLIANTNRLTCKTAGKYMISATIQWEGNATGIRRISLKLNGVTYLTRNTFTAVGASVCHQEVSTIYGLVATDYVTAEVRHTRGVNNFVDSAMFAFMMQRIG